MSSNSVQSLQDRLAERRALTQQQLSEHEASLLRESQRGLDGIRAATDNVRTVAEQMLSNMSEARVKVAETTAAEAANYKATLAAATSSVKDELQASMIEAKASVRRVVTASVLPLALVLGLALAGLLAALGASWWASRELAQVKALRASKASLEAFQGAQIVTIDGRPYLAAPRISQPVQLKDGRLAVQLNPQE